MLAAVVLLVVLLGFVLLVVFVDWFAGVEVFVVVFFLGGVGGGEVVWLKITAPVPLTINVSLLVGTDRSPCLIS